MYNFTYMLNFTFIIGCITGELGSRVVKMFVSQFLNVGVLILIINAKMGNNASANFIKGDYSDVDVNWYRGVAPTLVLHK